MREHVTGFLGFIRERGVAGLAIGFILGGAAQNLVKALMDDLINPLLAYFGGVKTIAEFSIGAFKVGDFISVLINFLILINLFCEYIISFWSDNIFFRI